MLHVLALLFSCAPPASDPAALPEEQAPPAPLTTSALVRGSVGTLSVSGLEWGARVSFAVSTNLQGPGVCPSFLAPTCLDLAAPWTALGEAVADQAGVATLTLTVPATAPARFEVQALARKLGGYQLSTSMIVDTLAPDVDTDGDGLLNAAETSSDPRLADTDADGLGDRQEAQAGTDPRDADSDDDLLHDGQEATLGTSPVRGDSDGDGLRDGDEVQLWQTDPRQARTHGVPDATWILPGHPLINEVQAANDSTLVAGGFSDWLELYNPTATAVDLSRATLRRGGVAWSPAGQLPAGGRLVILADEDTTDPAVAPFGLPKAGGSLILEWDGVEVDSALWGEVAADTTIARFPDGGAWALTAAPTPGASNGAAPTASADPSDSLYRTDAVPTVRIWLPPDSRASLDLDPYTEVPASLEVDGVYFPQVGVHLKGRLGSFRTLAEKAAFRVDLNAYEPRRLRGLENLTLNNMVQDPSYIHETLTYALFRALGVPAPRTGYVQVYVDDELFGLYLNVETVDDTFLERWYGDGSGPMWEGSYGTDFVPWAVGSFEYDEGPLLEDRTILERITTVLQDTPNMANLRRLQRLVDLDEVLAEQAVEHVTFHWDGYFTANNYRVYQDPADGRMSMIPWGTDQTWEWVLDPYDGNGQIFVWCLQVPECRTLYENHVELAARAVSAIDLAGQLDELAAFVEPLVPLDARGHRDVGWFQGSVATTRNTITTWPDDMLDRLQLDCDGQNDPPECFRCDPTPFGLMCAQPVDWHLARQVCRDHGMDLVMPRTEQLNQALSSYTAAYGQHWIGLSDEATEGRYQWVDGTVATWTSWWSGEPNNCCGGEHCIGTNFGDVAMWNDYTCSTRLPFACQRRP